MKLNIAANASSEEASSTPAEFALAARLSGLQGTSLAETGSNNAAVGRDGAASALLLASLRQENARLSGLDDALDARVIDLAERSGGGAGAALLRDALRQAATDANSGRNLSSAAVEHAVAAITGENASLAGFDS